MFRGFKLHIGRPIVTQPESDLPEEHLFKQIKESKLFKYLKTDKALSMRYKTEHNWYDYDFKIIFIIIIILL